MSSSFLRPASRLLTSSLPRVSVSRSNVPANAVTAAIRHYSSPSNPTQFSSPTNPALNTEEAKNRPGYEEYREEVEPKYAGVDQSFVFDHPKVSLVSLSLSSHLFNLLHYHHQKDLSSIPHQK